MPGEVRVGSSGTCPVLRLGLCPAPGIGQENQLGRAVNSGHVTTLCRSGGARLGRDALAQRLPDDLHAALRAEPGEDAGAIGLDGDHRQARHHNLASAPRPVTNAQTPGARSRSGYSCTCGSAPIGPAQTRVICMHAYEAATDHPTAKIRRSGVGLDERRSRCVVVAGRRFAGVRQAGMGGRVGRGRIGPAVRPGGLAS